MSALKDVLARAENWPVSAQQDLVNAALIIERNQDTHFTFDEADWKIIDARIADAARGEIATDEDMDAMYAKYRRA
jgi:hypothetical protein